MKTIFEILDEEVEQGYYEECPLDGENEDDAINSF